MPESGVLVRKYTLENTNTAFSGAVLDYAWGLHPQTFLKLP